MLRLGEQRRSDATRTVGRYQVFRDGVAVPFLSGATAEPGGPGNNDVPDCGLCVELGSYSLETHDGDKYCSIGYVENTDLGAVRRPALRLGDTGARSDVLLHPGHGFLASLGCLNPAVALVDACADIDHHDSRQRIVAIIADLRRYADRQFPTANGVGIPGARLVIETGTR